MSKYEPLPQFLFSTSGPAHRMTFSQIEQILGFKLPKSAYEHEAWWSNNATGHSHARAWLSVGWRTQDVDIKGRKVTFRRSDRSEAPPSRTNADPWGCMAGTVTILTGIDLTTPPDEKWNAEKGHLINE